MSERKRCYLGDGVYVESTQFGFALTVEDGIEVTNKIYLDIEVWRALKDFVDAEDGSNGNTT